MSEERSKKECGQCHQQKTKDEFAKKQWKKSNPSCYRCAEYTKFSTDKTRNCHQCKMNFLREEYAIYQWSKGSEALCSKCCDQVTETFMSRLGSEPDHVHNDDGTSFCAHGSEYCDICMVDFTLPNMIARKRNKLGRDLTENEHDALFRKFNEKNGIFISRKVCILDGQPMCPRAGKKMRCPCDEVTYCSKVCQKHHWMIHKMTCKWHLENQEKKKAKKEKQKKRAVNELTEEQKNHARMEAFLAENNGGEGSIDECAYQLGEHPLVIGGGSIRYGRDGEEFVKGDVAKIYRERVGVEWDGTARFGLGPYVPRKNPEDWIAKARQGKSQRQKDFEKGYEQKFGVSLKDAAAAGGNPPSKLQTAMTQARAAVDKVETGGTNMTSEQAIANLSPETLAFMEAQGLSGDKLGTIAKALMEMKGLGDDGINVD